jgi:peroxiredoxin
MKQDKSPDKGATAMELPAAPLTLEGFAVLHQMFRVRHAAWKALDSTEQHRAISEAQELFASMGRREDGESAVFSQLGHKGDVLVVHFRRTFDELNRAELDIAKLEIADYLEISNSYLSIIELGLYEASVALYERLAAEGVKPHSDLWQSEVESELERQRHKMAERLYPRIPPRRYLCFYPMDKKREGADNWYRLPIAERKILMREHGMVGRRYAGQVTQIISGSIGFDDWEWGVDLFADDPVVFKRLVYEMRFDEASAGYGKFGPFYFGIRTKPEELGKLFPG